MNQSFINRINSYNSTLSKAEKALAQYIIDEGETIPTCTIQEIAAHTFLSTATVSRFVKKIGYSSFQDFKLNLNKEDFISDDFLGELSESDSYFDILSKNVNKNIASLQATKELLSPSNFEEIMTVLLSAKRCALFGLGGSSAVALMAYHKFLRLPIDVHYQADSHFQRMLAAKLTQKDCAFVISHTGNNKDTLQILDILKKRHVPVIGITSFAGSPLAKKCDLALISISEETSFRPEAISSAIAQICLLDSIFMAYVMKTKKVSEPILDTIRQAIQETRL